MAARAAHAALLAAALVSQAASPATASPSASPAAAPAQRLLARARAAFRRGAFERAIELLGAAEKATSSPPLLARILVLRGVSAASNNDLAAAKSAFRRALLYQPDQRVDPARYKRAIVELFARVRRRTVGTLRLLGAARVSVDGRPLGRAPLTRALVAGPHQLRAVAGAGAAPISRRLTIKAGETTVVDLRKLASSGARRRRAKPRPSAPRPLRRSRLWTWVAAGTAVAALAAAAGVTAWARAAYNDGCDLLTSPPGACDQRGALRDPRDAARYDDLSASVDSRLRVAGVLWGVGAAAAVTALVLYFVEGRATPSGERRAADSSSPARFGATLAVQPGGAAATLMGRF